MYEASDKKLLKPLPYDQEVLVETISEVNWKLRDFYISGCKLQSVFIQTVSAFLGLLLSCTSSFKK